MDVCREAGVTCWVMENYVRARSLWESALGFSGYPFEYRLAVVSLLFPCQKAIHTQFFVLIAFELGYHTCQ